MAAAVAQVDPHSQQATCICSCWPMFRLLKFGRGRGPRNSRLLNMLCCALSSWRSEMANFARRSTFLTGVGKVLGERAAHEIKSAIDPAPGTSFLQAREVAHL
eukprot:7440571-Pyramimonas_sp.AAC.1